MCIAGPDTLPSFLNDLCASIMQSSSAKLSRERVRYRHNDYRLTLPVVSPNGGHDPFYISIETHHGTSYHVMFLNPTKFWRREADRETVVSGASCAPVKKSAKRR